jgi:hypothetical protein
MKRTAAKHRIHLASLNLEQSPWQGDSNSVSSAASPKLVHDILDVEINCSLRNRQFFRQSAYCEPLRTVVAFLLAVIAASVVVSLPIRPAVLG